jgi:hypothetical protein
MALDVNAPVYQSEITSFCQRLVDTFDPDCIILHGSMAQGTYVHDSDIDIVVIGGDLPANFLQRAYALNHLRDGSAPIEVVGYSRDEWKQMMANFHLTVLEALHWGKPLWGQSLFATWREQLAQWKEAGLRRKANSWVIPPSMV